MRTYLVDDHDRVLKIWRNLKLRAATLVHVDAHLDFGLYQVESPQNIIKSVSSISELKKSLEKAILYQRYEKSFEKQRDIGNYIYPAMRDCLVKEFWWVIPGDYAVFKKSISDIKKIAKACFGKEVVFTIKDKVLIAQKGTYLVNVTYLGGLPVFKQDVILDVDTDFMVIPDLKRANNVDCIGERKIEVFPKELYRTLNRKIKNIKCLTVAYSVKGNWTPAIFKYLGAEFAAFYDKRLKAKACQEKQACDIFLKFRKEKKSALYNQAIKLDKSLRLSDNNYGNLFLEKKQLVKAKKEFELILLVDSNNPFALAGMGDVSFACGKYKLAVGYFKAALSNCSNLPEYKELMKDLPLMLAESFFKAKKYQQAFIFANKAKVHQPLNPRGYFILAQIAQIKKDYSLALKLYEHCRKLGYGKQVKRNLEKIKKLIGK